MIRVLGSIVVAGTLAACAPVSDAVTDATGVPAADRCAAYQSALAALDVAIALAAPDARAGYQPKRDAAAALIAQHCREVL